MFYRGARERLSYSELTASSAARLILFDGPLVDGSEHRLRVADNPVAVSRRVPACESRGR
jgi:hypothetical protein